MTTPAATPTRTPWLILLLVLATLACPRLSAGTVLVEDRQPRARLVVAADQPQARQAAEAIQQYVKAMSGAELPIVTEGEAAPGDLPTTVWVGHTQHAADLGLQIPAGYDPTPRPDAFSEEGFVIQTQGNDVFVAGNQDGPFQGTLYAAYHLLEQLGCRWYFPGEWGEVIPEKASLEVAEQTLTSKPDFPCRYINLSAWIPISAEERAQYDAWAIKVGLNKDPMYPLVGDGFLAYLVPPAEYFEEHPEYFALSKAGHRENGEIREGVMYERYAMLCLPNPAVYDESVKNLKEAFAGQRKMRNVVSHGFGISPPDGAPYCYCEEFPMQSLNLNYPRYVHERMMSEEFFGFAARLAEEFPDKYVSTMAYSNREMPPLGVDMPDNMMVQYAPISCDVMHANDTNLWRRRDFVHILQQWVDQTPHVVIYDYNPGMLTGMFLPEGDAQFMAINAPMYRDMGVKGMWREGRKAFMQTWISYYITGKLLWDADADVDALMDDFYNTFFGAEAGPHVRAWWDACAKQLSDSPMQAHEDFLTNHVYDLKFVESIAPHLEQAKAAAKGSASEKQLQRLEVVTLIAQHMEAYARMAAAEAEMDWPAAAGFGDRMVELKEALHEASPFLMEVDKKLTRIYFAEGRAKAFRQHEARWDGTDGKLIAELPRTMSFQRDPFNQGIVRQWYKTDLDDTAWDTRDSHLLWQQQEVPLSPEGHDYDGYGWYRTTAQIDPAFAGQPVHLYLGGVINEGWVWVNGRFAGHKPHDLWWSHNNQFELDITPLIQVGQPNQITLRVWNDADVGGLFRRGYLWSPNPTTEGDPQE